MVVPNHKICHNKTETQIQPLDVFTKIIVYINDRFVFNFFIVNETMPILDLDIYCDNFKI